FDQRNPLFFHFNDAVSTTFEDKVAFVDKLALIGSLIPPLWIDMRRAQAQTVFLIECRFNTRKQLPRCYCMGLLTMRDTARFRTAKHFDGQRAKQVVGVGSCRVGQWAAG